MADASEFPLLQRATEYSHKKIWQGEFLQGVALLAVAEAIHRLAEVTERQGGARA